MLPLIVAELLMGTAQTVSAADFSATSPAERRNAVLETAKTKPANGVMLLTQALNDENMLVRRAAARSLMEFGKSAEQGLAAGLANSDSEVRMICLTGLKKLEIVTYDQLASAIKDENIAVRQRALDMLIGMKPYTKETEALLELATRDKEQSIRESASRATFPFYRKVSLLRDRVDNIVTSIDKIPLPRDGWKLKPDPMLVGHKEKWFDPDLKDDDWNHAEIGKYWGEFGTNYTGAAWYRGRFKLPAKPQKYDAVEIEFGAVDESAWVWINGEYAGQHDLGAGLGWDEPFLLDVTEFIKWGQENQITVRVLNTALGGGIWKPVTVNIQRVGQ